MNAPIRVVLNPAAGNGRARSEAPAVSRRLRELGAEFEIVRTLAPGHATELARDFAAKEPDGVVAVLGGDGTVHEVVQALGASGGRGVLAFLPGGGGNDAARTIGSPRLLAAAVDVACRGTEKRIDLGVFAGELFFNGVGIGLDGAAAARSKEFTRLRGLPAYLLSAVATIATFEPPLLTLSAEGFRREEPALLCAIGNGPSCGGGFLLTPDARADDGLLDACLFGALGRLRTLATLPKALTGDHRRHPKATFVRGVAFTVSADRSLYAHADGEIRRPDFPVAFSVLPGAIRVRTGGSSALDVR
ncbi:MAG TPA: diacylglycerol kinase family protein [Thermoanaerobaculia bacterium]|nr:diacylglycerol kinase family protein [Thermoanaerobaculia bacterium]